MKGILLIHLRSFLDATYPALRWGDLLSECGIAQMFASGWDYPDSIMTTIVDTACRRLRVSQAEFWYRFGRHSMKEFRKNYRWYFDERPDARAFFISLNETHADAVAHIPGASPPTFETRLGDDRRELALTYRSPRHLVSYLRGAIDGILDIYGEKADVSMQEDGGCAVFTLRFH